MKIARGRVAEAGHRAAPVLLVGERGALLARHLLAPAHQPRARAAGLDLLAELAYAFSFLPLLNSHWAHR